MSSSFEQPADPTGRTDPDDPDSVDHVREVSEVLLGGRPRYRKAEVAEAAGVELARAERLWQAMGFSHVEDDEVVFTDSDVAALQALVRLVSAEVITPELETAVARTLAQTMSRLAEWQVGIFRSVLGAEFARDAATTADLARAVLPVMEQMQNYVWRRHLAATAVRELTDTGTEERVQVIGFADIVGYTRLIRDYTELELARLIDSFEELVTSVVAQNRGRIVKTVGDEVLFVTENPADAAEIALSLNERIEQSEIPPLRIGLARGAVLERFGDVYGSTVNIASRLTSVARPSSVLIDQELAEAVRPVGQYRLTPLGPQKVPSFGGVRAWSLRRAD